MSPQEILAVPIQTDDAPEAKTIRDYLKAMLKTLWEEAEGFSGKRPFGNGGWQFDVYKAMIQAKAIKGTLDKDGYVDKCDTDLADNMIQEAIDAL